MYVHISYCLAASPPGVLVVPLSSMPHQVLIGERIEISYLIALVNSSLNVTSNVVVSYILRENLKLLDQGRDVYTVIIPSATLPMDRTLLQLQFEGLNISSSQVLLRVFGMYTYVQYIVCG